VVRTNFSADFSTLQFLITSLRTLWRHLATTMRTIFHGICALQVIYAMLQGCCFHFIWLQSGIIVYYTSWFSCVLLCTLLALHFCAVISEEL